MPTTIVSDNGAALYLAGNFRLTAGAWLERFDQGYTAPNGGGCATLARERNVWEQ